MASRQGPCGAQSTSATWAALIHGTSCALPEHVQNSGCAGWDEEAIVARAIEKLNAVHARASGRCRSHRVGLAVTSAVQRSPRNPVDIIVAAGLYVYEEMPHQYAYARAPACSSTSPAHGHRLLQGHHPGHRRYQRRGPPSSCARRPPTTPGVGTSPAPSARRTSRPARPSPCTPRAHTNRPDRGAVFARRASTCAGDDRARGRATTWTSRPSWPTPGSCSAWTVSVLTCSIRRPNG